MFLSRTQASATDRSPAGNWWFEPVGMRSAGGMRVTSMTAMQLSAVYTCVKILAETFAVLPFRMYRRGQGRKRTEVADHWLYKLLAIRPNPYQTPFEWKEMMEGHLALRGNAFNEVFANRRGEIEALIPIHPDRIKIEMLDNGSYRYRIRRVDGTEDIRPRGDIWHLRGLSSDGIVGLSPLELAREVIGLGLSAQSFGSRFFYNDAKPGGWLEMPVGGKFKDDDEKDKFKQNWQKGYSGANRGKTAILEGGMKYHELTLNNADAQFLETHKQNRVEIAGLFGVPAHRVNELDRATFSNIEQQSLDFVVGTMTPIAERWESSITAFLLPEDEGLEVEFDFANLVRGDMAARGVFYNKLFNMGSLSPNDIRAREGEPEVAGGDIYLVPMNMVSLENAGKPQAKKGVRPAPAPATQPEPEETATEEDGGTDARMARLLLANATRMARRMAGGKAPAADVLAEAMAISPARAQVWLDTNTASQDQAGLTNALMALAAPEPKKETP